MDISVHKTTIIMNKFYKSCAVPQCVSTTIITPNKLFLYVPHAPKIRKKWLQLARRDPKYLSPRSTLFFCEDHFDIEEDTENYMQYKIMTLEQGEKVALRLKKGVVPHKFQCQERKAKVPPVRMGALKRQHQDLVQQAISEYDLLEKGPSTHKVFIISNDFANNIDSETTSEISSSKPLSDSILQGSIDIQINNNIHRSEDIDVDLKVEEDTMSAPSSPCENISRSLQSSPTIKIECIDNPLEISTTIKIESIDNPIETSTTSINSQSSALSIKNELTTDDAVETSITNIHLEPSILSTDYAECNSESSRLESLPIDNPFELSITNIHSQSSLITTDNPECNSESSQLSYKSVNDLLFQTSMRSVTSAAIEKEPKLLLGLPKKNFHLVKQLSENIPLPSIEILIALRKIKLNESLDLLGVNFGYSPSKISSIFFKTVVAISQKMKELIVWPTLSDIVENLPIPFKAKYSNVVSIIDCLEIQVEKPNNAIHQSLSWSPYKKYETLKYLISYTPDGLVNYISKGYSGRFTDDMIVEDCGYLDNILPGKSIMADRAFNYLTHLLESKNCTLVRPLYCKSSIKILKQSKQITDLRIHIEHVLSRIREFNMLVPHAYIDHNLIPVMDKVVIIACALINLQDVLIKQ